MQTPSWRTTQRRWALARPTSTSFCCHASWWPYTRAARLLPSAVRPTHAASTFCRSSTAAWTTAACSRGLCKASTASWTAGAGAQHAAASIWRTSSDRAGSKGPVAAAASSRGEQLRLAHAVHVGCQQVPLVVSQVITTAHACPAICQLAYRASKFSVVPNLQGLISDIRLTGYAVCQLKRPLGPFLLSGSRT